MKLLTKDNEVVEGNLISEGMVKLIEDLDNGTLGLGLYPHQKKNFFGYMLENFELTLKLKPAPVESHTELEDALEFNQQHVSLEA